MTIVHAQFFHLIGVIFLFIGFGGLMAIGENRSVINKIVASFHGAGLLILLITGFMAQGVGKYGFPGWIITKLILWLAMVFLFVMVKKDKLNAKTAVIISAVVGIVVVYLCKFKPF